MKLCKIIKSFFSKKTEASQKEIKLDSNHRVIQKEDGYWYPQYYTDYDNMWNCYVVKFTNDYVEYYVFKTEQEAKEWLS
ncbi:MAG: hypothetical protein R3321_01190 [Nitrososphaeraceae archaeon]|nr:hypothetical protein [Nitrososphaeraceae archaeon]